MSAPIVSEVREAYQYGVGDLPAYHSKEYGPAWRERGEQFDRWLADIEAKAWDRGHRGSLSANPNDWVNPYHHE